MTLLAVGRSIGREPFVHFIVLGLFVWGGVEFRSGPQSRYTIEIGPVQEQYIVRSYFRQFEKMPTPSELNSLLERYIRETIYLREGLALKLDENDEIIRRRIVQKYEFLQTDLAAVDSPPAVVLETWFERNKSRYVTPAHITFQHLYFSIDKDGERAAKLRADRALKTLRASGNLEVRTVGDAFPGPLTIESATPEDVARVFGQSELSEKVLRGPVDRWIGPFRSGFGWHLVYVTGRRSSGTPSLRDVHEQVLSDWQSEQRELLNKRAFDKLRARYTVRFDGSAG